MAQTILKITLWFVIAALGIGGLVLSVVGLGELHKRCKDNEAYENDDDVCDEEFRSTWWAILFAFCSGVLVLVSGWWGWLAKTRTLALNIAFLVMSSVDLMDEAEKGLVLLDERRGLSEPLDAAQLAFVQEEENPLGVLVAGLLCMTAANWLVMITTTTMIEEGGVATKNSAGAAAPLA